MVDFIFYLTVRRKMVGLGRHSVVGWRCAHYHAWIPHN